MHTFISGVLLPRLRLTRHWPGQPVLTCLHTFLPTKPLDSHQTQRQNCFHTGSSGIPGGISKGPESFILPVTTEWRVELFVHWESTLKTTTECLIFNMAMRFGYGGCQSLAARVTGCCLSDLA